MKKLGFIVVIGWFCSTASHEFLVHKKKKSPSVSKLTEQCCESFGRQQPLLSDIIVHSAKIQKEEFRLLAAEVDSESCLKKCSQERLAAALSASEQIERQVQALADSLKSYADLLTSL